MFWSKCIHAHQIIPEGFCVIKVEDKDSISVLFPNYFSTPWGYILYNRIASYLACPYCFVVFFIWAVNCIKDRKGAVLEPTSSGPYSPLSNVINYICPSLAGTDLSSCYCRLSTRVLCKSLPMVQWDFSDFILSNKAKWPDVNLFVYGLWSLRWWTGWSDLFMGVGVLLCYM